MTEDQNGKLITDILPQQLRDIDLDQNISNSIIKHNNINQKMAQQPEVSKIQQISTTDDMGAEAVAPSTDVSRKGLDLNPKEDSNIVNKADPSPSPGDTSIADEATEENDLDKQTSDNPYEAVDSLPDKNTITTEETKDNMQNPKIYDTKEYFVPIKNTTHSHGGLGIVIAGIVSALIVLAVIIFIVLAKY